MTLTDPRPITDEQRAQALALARKADPDRLGADLAARVEAADEQIAAQLANPSGRPGSYGTPKDWARQCRDVLAAGRRARAALARHTGRPAPKADPYAGPPAEVLLRLYLQAHGPDGVAGPYAWLDPGERDAEQIRQHRATLDGAGLGYTTGETCLDRLERVVAEVQPLLAALEQNHSRRTAALASFRRSLGPATKAAVGDAEAVARGLAEVALMAAGPCEAIRSAAAELERLQGHLGRLEGLGGGLVTVELSGHRDAAAAELKRLRAARAEGALGEARALIGSAVGGDVGSFVRLSAVVEANPKAFPPGLLDALAGAALAAMTAGGHATIWEWVLTGGES